MDTLFDNRLRDRSERTAVAQLSPSAEAPLSS